MKLDFPVRTNLRAVVRHAYVVTVDGIIWLGLKIMDMIGYFLTAAWVIARVRRWWRARSAFNRHTTWVATVHTLIAIIPAVFVGFVMAALGYAVPVQPFDNQSTAILAGGSSGSLTFIAIEVVVLGRLKDLLRLNPSTEVIDEIIGRRTIDFRYSIS